MFFINQKINFKKDVYFKELVSEITDISINHDYKIYSDVVEGKFIIDAKYNSASLENDEKIFDIPFTIAISENIIKETIDINIADFNYILDKDKLHIDVLIDLSYEKEENIDKPIDEILEENLYKEEEKINDIPKEDVEQLKEKTKDKIKSVLIDSSEEEYSKYKVYIVRSEDTLESIAIKYNVSTSLIKECNNITEINTSDKLIIPVIDNESN